MDFNEKVPDWRAEGTEPPESLKESGFQAGDKPPAPYFNWFWCRVSACLKEIREKLSGHAANKENPHGVTAAQLGLDKVNNTPDTEKYVAFAQEAGTARKNQNSMIIRLNGGRTENTDQFTYDGSTGRTVNVTPEKIGAAAENHTHTPADVGAVSKSGDTMTGSLNVVSASAGTTDVSVKNPNGHIALQTATNRGIWDYDKKAWVLRALRGSTDWHLIGTADNVTGTVDIKNGGTGANNVEAARTNLGLDERYETLGYGTSIPSDADLNTYTTVGNYRCTTSDVAVTLKNCPTDIAFVLQVRPSTGTSTKAPTTDGWAYFLQEITNMRGKKYFRHIDYMGSTTPNVGTWYTNYDEYNKPTASDVGALPQSGGTLTGALKLKGSTYAETDSTIDGMLDCDNSNIIGANGIYFKDEADGITEGLHFYRSATSYDTLWAAKGKLYFTPNRALNTAGTAQTVLHTGNAASQLESLIANGGMSTLQSAIQVTNTTLTDTDSTFTGTGKGKLFISSPNPLSGYVTIDGKSIGTGNARSTFEVEFLKSFSVKSSGTSGLHCTAVFY